MFKMTHFCLLAISLAWAAEAPAEDKQRRPIVHDAEFYIVAEQNGKRWAGEDRDNLMNTNRIPGCKSKST